MMLEHDPEKVGTGFPKRSCSNKKLERDADPAITHPALVRFSDLKFLSEFAA
jgi:hypothetical protein